MPLTTLDRVPGDGTSLHRGCGQDIGRGPGARFGLSRTCQQTAPRIPPPRPGARLCGSGEGRLGRLWIALVPPRKNNSRTRPNPWPCSSPCPSSSRAPPARPPPRSSASSSMPVDSPLARPKSLLDSARPKRDVPTPRCIGHSARSSGPTPRPATSPPRPVRAYRDALEQAGRSPAAVAKRLSVLRGLAEALGVETQQLHGQDPTTRPASSWAIRLAP
jgi:hypothetical protein